MMNPPLQVVLIEDNPDHAMLIRRQLQHAGPEACRVEWVERVADGIDRLRKGDIDAVLTDLRLPDSDLSQTLPQILEVSPDIPIIVLTSLDDVETATHAVQQGAQDYLIKTDLDGQLLLRSLRYAVERKRNHLELQRYARDLERSNSELQHFATVAAHELKSPLWVAGFALDLVKNAKDGQLDAEIKDFVNSGSAAVKQMVKLINDLLQYALVGAESRLAVACDCEAILERVLSALRLEIGETGAQVTHDPLPTLSGHPEQLGQVFQNLLSNAIKYRSAAPPRIHVSAVEQGPEWQFRVRDNGIGIPPDSTSRIFTVFERLHSSTDYPGTGVGLSICQKIIESHNGRIWVESREGEGSTFFFTLPTAN